MKYASGYITVIPITLVLSVYKPMQYQEPITCNHGGLFGFQTMDKFCSVLQSHVTLAVTV